MSSNRNVDTHSSGSEHLLGRVKWFNNKAGYGFITVTDGTRAGTDVFVHHTAINVENQQYKYLVQGEYVEFDYIKTDSDKHEYQASQVSGVKGGKLMCETRHELRAARTEYKNTTTSTEKRVEREPNMPKQRVQKTAAPRSRGEGPRESAKKGWTLVGENKQPRAQVRTSNGSTIITIQSK